MISTYFLAEYSLGKFVTTSTLLTTFTTVVDDGERVTQMATIIGRAYLSMLNLLDRAGQLGPDSEFKDLALVTALFLKVPSHFVDAYDEKEMDWKTYVQDYAECHKIDISFVFGSPEITFVDENVETLDDREGIPKAGVDRWGFKKAVCIRMHVKVIC